MDHKEYLRLVSRLASAIALRNPEEARREALRRVREIGVARNHDELLRQAKGWVDAVTWRCSGHQQAVKEGLRVARWSQATRIAAVEIQISNEIYAWKRGL